MRVILLAMVAYLAGFSVAAATGYEKPAGEVMEHVDDLTMALFLQEANTAYTKGNYRDARIKLQWLAERGNAMAQLGLGTLYEEARGTPRDYAKAAYWYENAARMGLAKAQVRLARMHYFGRHVKQDNFLAYVWSSVAAQQGDATGKRNRDKLASLLSPGQIDEAQSLTREWAAQFNLR